jgi:hypothetical protein
MKTKTAYKALCADLGLRYSRDACGDPVSRTRSRKTPKDALWCAYADWIGVTVVRDSRQALTWAVKKLEALGCEPTQVADLEANLRCPADKAQAVAAFLKCTKAKTGGRFYPRQEGDCSPQNQRSATDPCQGVGE